MEDFDYQGKRKHQVEFSEKMVGWSIIGFIVTICAIALYNIFTKI